jgi:hypothetical protein
MTGQSPWPDLLHPLPNIPHYNPEHEEVCSSVMLTYRKNTVLHNNTEDAIYIYIAMKTKNPTNT